MRIDLSFWRVVLFLNVAKSGTWGKDGDTWLLHVGTFSKEGQTALQVVVLPFSVQLGWLK